MPKPRIRVALLLGLITLPLAASALAMADWPQFRGIDRDGRSPAQGLAHSWPEGGPKVVWRHAIGSGFSGMSVVGDRLYTMATEGEKEYALCFDAASGQEIWRVEVGGRFLEEFGDGPRSTPTVDGDRVYVLGAKGGLFALAAKDGAKQWSADLVAQFGSEVPRWGFAPSPLIDGEQLILEAGGKEGKAIIAFAKKDGSIRWSYGEGPSSYNSPIQVEIAGQKQYIFGRRTGPEPQIFGLSPEGKLLWTHPAPATTIAIPIFIPPDKVYVSAGDDAGAVLIQVQKEADAFKVTELWRNPRMKNHFNAAVMVGGHLYGFDNAIFKSIAVADGSQAWATRGFGKGSLVAADGMLIVLSDEGAVGLVEATPEAFVEKARAQILSGRTWTSPSLAGTRLYLRDLDEIVCLDLAPGAPTPAPAAP